MCCLHKWTDFSISDGFIYLIDDIFQVATDQSLCDQDNNSMEDSGKYAGEQIGDPIDKSIATEFEADASVNQKLVI